MSKEIIDHLQNHHKEVAEFQRENRYIVIKRSDLKRVPVSYREHLVSPMLSLLAHLPNRECLVIESDWPEYEPTWSAIEARMTGVAPQPPALGGELEARQAFDDWFRKDLGLPECANTTFIGAAREPWRAWQACSAVYRVHLAPLKDELERLKSDIAAYKASRERLHGWIREEQLKNVHLKARCGELEHRAADVVEGFDGEQLPGAMTMRIRKLKAALSKPAGSEKV